MIIAIIIILVNSYLRKKGKVITGYGNIRKVITATWANTRPNTCTSIDY